MKRYALFGLLLVLCGCGSGGGGTAPVLFRHFAVRMANAGRPDNHTVGSYSVLAQGASFEHPGGDIALTFHPSVLWGSGNDNIITNAPVNVRVRVYDSLDATGPILQEFNKVITVPATNQQNLDGSFGYQLDLQSSGNLIP